MEISCAKHAKSVDLLNKFIQFSRRFLSDLVIYILVLGFRSYLPVVCHQRDEPNAKVYWF